MRIYEKLSPLTQKEVLNELCELKSRGINVVYSTHSPYLIPNDWESVHFVTMTNSGTTLTQENKYDLLKQSAYHPTLDHIRPLSAGGCDVPENIIICHRDTNEEKAEYGNRLWRAFDDARV